MAFFSKLNQKRLLKNFLAKTLDFLGFVILILGLNLKLNIMTKIAVFFPTEKSKVQPYLSNVKIQLAPPPTGADLAVKYGLDPTKVTKINTWLTEIPDHLAKAEMLRNQAQSETEQADAKIRLARLLNHEFGDDMQKHSAFDVADFELMGYKVVHTPADPNLAKVKITNIVYLPDMIRLEWAKEAWHGVKIYSSYDGVTYAYLDKDNKSPFDDMRKNQVANTPEHRWYKFRHLDKDGNEIGVETVVEVVAAIY
jgi:hypothetical protein